jgi:hypothetical protein
LAQNLIGLLELLDLALEILDALALGARHPWSLAGIDLRASQPLA